MKLKLKEIATISLGVSFRSGVKASTTGDVRLIQMKDLDAHNVQLKRAIYIEYTKLKAHQLVTVDDIIFRSRGQVTTAALLTQKAEKTILAAPLLRIRINRSYAVPKYILWWINQPYSQNYLSKRAEGTHIKMVNKQELEHLEVELPPIERQQGIVKFFNLALQEQALLHDIRVKRSRYTQEILVQMASSSSR